MAGAAKAKLTLKVGAFIQVPVIAKAATREEKVLFNLHHGIECGGAIGNGSSYCKGCGEEVGAEEIVRGYKGKPGVDDEYLKSLEFAKTGALEVEGFVDASEIDPRQYQRSYALVADDGAEKVYVLLAQLLDKHQKVGIGRVVMGGREYIVTLRPKDGVLAVELMWWPSEVLSDEEALQKVEHTTVSEQEVAMGDQLVKMMTMAYEPSQYENRLHVARMEYLDRFLEGAESPAAPKPMVAGKPTEDLAAALAAAVRAAEATTKEKIAAKKAPAKKVAA